MSNKFCVGSVFSLLIVVLLAGPAATSLAGPYSCFCQYGPYVGGLGCGYGYCYGDGNFGSQVPYFSLHPPVYYSHPMAYPFGYSPFPNPPYAAVAEEWRNDAGAAQTAHSPPLRIVNPFVTQTNTATELPSAIPPARAPKVIYPAAMAGGVFSAAAENRSGHGPEKR